MQDLAQEQLGAVVLRIVEEVGSTIASLPMKITRPTSTVRRTSK
ncbi:hypothetical protein AK973_2640 [Pseudomonas brassicacearum]|jgi:hypothetical protein|nr:hypothetical protein AK973_2640 [Pseudomonas brassicacearum]